MNFTLRSVHSKTPISVVTSLPSDYMVTILAVPSDYHCDDEVKCYTLVTETVATG